MSGVARIGQALILVLAACTSAVAEVRKPITLESVPPGAQVFLLRGAQKVPIGVTPVQYEAEFHSEISILRFRFERAGFSDSTIEVSASQDRAVATLVGRALLAEPASQVDPGLRKLQQQVNAALGRDLLQVLGGWPDWELDLAGEVRVRRLKDGSTLLHMPLSLSNPKEVPAEGLARAFWDGPAGKIASSVRSRLTAVPGVSQLLIEASVATLGHRFGVASRAQAKTEMTCIPGTRQVYDSCIRSVPTYETECRAGNCTTRQTGTRCVGGMKSVYDACATRAPVTKVDVKIDPQAATATALRRLYVLTDLRSSSSPAILHTDEGGRRLFEQGKVPDEVVAGAAAR